MNKLLTVYLITILIVGCVMCVDADAKTFDASEHHFICGHVYKPCQSDTITITNTRTFESQTVTLQDDTFERKCYLFNLANFNKHGWERGDTFAIEYNGEIVNVVFVNSDRFQSTTRHSRCFGDFWTVPCASWQILQRIQNQEGSRCRKATCYQKDIQ